MTTHRNPRILAAEEKGRRDALNYCARRNINPLAMRPVNPYPHTEMDLREAWTKSFDEHVIKYLEMKS